MRDDIFSSRRRAEKQNAREKWTTTTMLFTTGGGGSDSRWRSLRYGIYINNRFRFLSFFLSPGKKRDAFPLETRFVSSCARYMHTFGSDENHILPEVESIRTMFASTIPQEISDPSCHRCFFFSLCFSLSLSLSLFLYLTSLSFSFSI